MVSSEVKILSFGYRRTLENDLFECMNLGIILPLLFATNNLSNNGEIKQSNFLDIFFVSPNTRH